MYGNGWDIFNFNKVWLKLSVLPMKYTEVGQEHRMLQM